MNTTTPPPAEALGGGVADLVSTAARRLGADPAGWRDGLDPWRVTVEQDRWYGRGTADNNGQHTINLAAAEQVLRVRDRLGLNATILIEAPVRRTDRPGCASSARATATSWPGDARDLDGPARPVGAVRPGVPGTHHRRRHCAAANLGGSLPNDAFAEELGPRTVWLPRSYPACAQHAPDEHLLAPLARQSLCLMAGLCWDLGEVSAGPSRR
ncbi:MAG TPA: hypothetical protein VFW65_38665 [Pseudonocardiaceae bacterium]|nr:hypothetical protein [Pseudonocardiaceae bacterium]